MRVSTITSSKDVNILIGYICSSCGNPILSSLTMHCEVEMQVKFSYDNAKANVARILDAVLSEGLLRLAACRNENAPQLFYKQPVKQTVKGNGYGYSIFNGVQTPCPICANTERWQKEFAKSDVEKPLSEENFPTPFVNKDEAIAWVNGKLNRSRSKYQLYWAENEDRLSALQRERQEVLCHIEKLKAENATLPERAQIKALLQEHADITREMRKAPLFSHEKKCCKAAAKDRAQRALQINRSIGDVDADYDARIKADEMRIEKLDKELTGSSGNTLSKAADSSLGFYLE